MRTRDIAPNRAWVAAILILLLLLSWGLHLHQLDGKSIWSDEGLSIYRARKSILFNLTNKIIVQDVVTKDTQPPLYFILLHLLRRAAGESEFALRYLSVAFAALIVPMVYALGARLISKRAGLFAGGLAALAPTLLWYAQEIRMYTMLVFVSLLSLYTLLNLLDEAVGWRRSKVLWLIAYLASTGAMIYTHYSGFFLLAFQGALILGFIIRSKRWRMMAAILLATLAVSPLLPFVIRRLGTGVERDFVFVPLNIILLDLINGFAVGISVDLSNTVWWDILGAAVFALGVWAVRSDGLWGKRGKSFALLGYLFLPILALWVASHIKPMYMGVRHLLIVAPAYFLAAGAALDYLSRHRWWWASMIVALGLLGGNIYATDNYFHDPAYVKDDLRALTLYVRQRYRPGDIVVLNDAVIGEAISYYAPDMLWTAQPYFGHLADEATLKACQALADSHERIWFVYGPPSTFYDPEQKVRAWFEEHLFKLDMRRFAGYGNEVGVLCYATTSPVLSRPDHPMASQTLSMTDPTSPLALLAYALPQDTPSGEALPISLYWQLLEPADARYKVSVRLKDLNGELWAQSDREPFLFFPTDIWPTDTPIRHIHEVLLPPGTPAGSYTAELRVYEADSGRVVPMAGGAVEAGAEQIDLGQLTIVPPIRQIDRRLLPPHRRTHIAFDNKLLLTAHTAVADSYAPGGVVHVDGYWQLTQATDQRYRLQIELIDGDGAVAQTLTETPGLAGWPTDQWPVDHLVRDQINLELAKNLAGGTYTLRLAAIDPDGQTVSARRGWLPLLRSHYTLGRVQVEPLPPTVKSGMTSKLDVTLGNNMSLLGYDLPVQTIRPGDPLTLTLYWRAEAETDMGYKVFTHVFDGQERIWGQWDSVPAQATRPTHSWAVGETIVDPYAIPMKPDTPAGTYTLAVGMYDPDTGIRLPALDQTGAPMPADRVILTEITVIP